MEYQSYKNLKADENPDALFSLQSILGALGIWSPRLEEDLINIADDFAAEKLKPILNNWKKNRDQFSDATHIVSDPEQAHRARLQAQVYDFCIKQIEEIL